MGTCRLSLPSRRLVGSISFVAEGQIVNRFARLRIIANRSMSYFTEGLINNARVHVNVFPSVNGVPIDQIGSDPNISVKIAGRAVAGENDSGYSRSHMIRARDGEAVILKRLFFGMNIVVSGGDRNTVGAGNYKGVCGRFVPGVAEWKQDGDVFGRGSAWYGAERQTDRSDPGSISGDQGFVRVVSGNPGDNQRTNNA